MTEKHEIKDNIEVMHDESQALASLISIMQPLPDEVKERLLRTVSTFFDIKTAPNNNAMAEPQVFVDANSGTPTFSEDRTMSPKEFLLEKQPRTDVERVAILAYYLTHYRDTPHFKTIDISKLNTEAAQRKFTNAAKAVDNASRSELLVPSTKGQKQLGAFGEVFVQELPDRDAAKAAIAHLKPRRKRAVKSKRK
ncbi:MAG: hypothetical protein OQK32_01075 [Gammaproteobacteria bacterium]|nr:hypothetical protein [Gammaproteobacteria bacterium]MCW8923131.1 hypothetical protein [Gammaproteobacteria bacterium]